MTKQRNKYRNEVWIRQKGKLDYHLTASVTFEP